MKNSGWLLLILMSGVGQSAPASYNRPERLLLATQQLYPYQYVENEVIKGFGIEKLKCILRRMEQPYQLTMINWDRAQLLTEVGTQNGFFLASQNDKRDEYAVMSAAIGEQNWSWFSLSDLAEVNTPMFKSNVEVTALFGSNSWYWLQKEGYQVIKNPRSPKAMLNLMINGDVSVILGNELVIDETIKEMGISYRAIFKVRAKSQPLGVYFSKAFIKKYPLFLTNFNDAIKPCE